MTSKEIKLVKIIDELQKKVSELHKYKNFIELQKNSKNFFEKFQKITNNNVKLVNHIKEQNNTIELLKREKDEYKNKFHKMKENGLNFANKKKFYELNLKINDIEKQNDELKNIIKNKEMIFQDINIKVTELQEQNNSYDNIIKTLINSYNNLQVSESQEIKEETVKENIELDKEEELKDEEEQNNKDNEDEEDNEEYELENITDISEENSDILK